MEYIRGVAAKIKAFLRSQDDKLVVRIAVESESIVISVDSSSEKVPMHAARTHVCSHAYTHVRSTRMPARTNELMQIHEHQ